MSSNDRGSLVKLRPRDAKLNGYIEVSEDQVVAARWQQVSNWPDTKDV